MRKHLHLSSIYHRDFPWKKSSSDWGTSMSMETAAVILRWPRQPPWRICFTSCWIPLIVWYSLNSRNPVVSTIWTTKTQLLRGVLESTTLQNGFELGVSSHAWLKWLESLNPPIIYFLGQTRQQNAPEWGPKKGQWKALNRLKVTWLFCGWNLRGLHFES